VVPTFERCPRWVRDILGSALSWPPWRACKIGPCPSNADCVMFMETCDRWVGRKSISQAVAC
jgi:hypothetical protein